MRKFYILFTLMMLLARYLNAQFYTQYFDGADTVFVNSVNIELDTSGTNIWQIGPPQKPIFNSAATLPNALVTDTINYYPDNNVSSFQTKMYNQIFPPWGILAFQWMQKLDMDHDSDGGLIEFSIDSGATWQNAFNNPYVYNFYGFDPSNQDTLNSGEYAFSGTDSSWKNVWLCFDLSWMNFNLDTIRFRFTLKSDSVNNNREGWMIDNMFAQLTMIHTIHEVKQANYLNVYPNPSGNVIHIEARKLMEFHIIEKMELVDSGGKIVETWENVPTKFWFRTDKYGDGAYFLKVKTNKQSETIPIVISKH